MNIHPTAIVEPGAEVDAQAHVGPFCYVGPKVRIGAGTRLLGHVTVMGRTSMGVGNTVWPQATLGADPQDLKYQGEPTHLMIGDNNEIRESVTIHLGTENGGGVTRIGNENLVMVGAHIAHDCSIDNHVIMGNAVHLAGHVRIHDHAVISGATGVHHYVTVGPYAFIGGMTRLVHDAPPFMIVEGNPSKVRGVNVVGLSRHRFNEESILRLKDTYRRLFRGGAGVGNGEATSMAGSLIQVENEYRGDECISLLVQFIRNASIGLHGRFRESVRTDQRMKNPVK